MKLPDNFFILKNELLKIKEKDFVPCTRPNNKDGGIGNTLEDLLNITENNLQEADFLGYEVKSQKEVTSSAITLFSMATEEKGNRKLFNYYKKLDDEDNIERLYWTIHMNSTAFLYGKYEVKLEFDDERTPKYLYVNIKNVQTGEIGQAYWVLEKIRSKIIKKIKNLVVCFAESKNINSKKYFKYNFFECYFDFNFDKFIEYIKQGHIQVDFRIGADLTGKKAGKYHDHGTAFRIQGKNLLNLYEDVKKF